MIPEESVWIVNSILECSKDFKNSVLLNVGSSTKTFREKEQPHIEKNIFSVLKINAINVTHLDIKPDEGVDLVGDLNDPSFLNIIQKKQYNLILCSNLLEHILNPENICHAIENCIIQNGYIIVTVPYVYRYHSDPIDTMFRPSPDEMKSFFPNCKMIKGEILTINDTFFKNILREKYGIILFIIRLLTPFYKFKRWKKFIFQSLPYLFKKYKVTCVVFKKIHLEFLK